MAATLREEDRIVGIGVALVTPSDRGQHRHQCRCRCRRLEQADEPSYQGSLGAPPTISRRRSCRGQRPAAGGPETSTTTSTSTRRASARVSCGAQRRGAGTNSGGAEQAGSCRRAAAPKLTGSRPGAVAAAHRASEENRLEDSVRESEWGWGEGRARGRVDPGLSIRVGRPIGPSGSGPAHFW
jgi:hypothetical protein